MSTTHSTTYSNQLQASVLQDQFGFKLAARLSEGATEVPHDISERLRIARSQALAQRKKLQPALVTSSEVSRDGATLTLGGNERVSLWGRFASVVPLIALVAGLFIINVVENDVRARELAEVDSALLTDNLPPSAYVDPGFVQFLKVSAEQTQ